METFHFVKWHNIFITVPCLNKHVQSHKIPPCNISESNVLRWMSRLCGRSRQWDLFHAWKELNFRTRLKNNAVGVPANISNHPCMLFFLWSLNSYGSLCFSDLPGSGSDTLLIIPVAGFFGCFSARCWCCWCLKVTFSALDAKRFSPSLSLKWFSASVYYNEVNVWLHNLMDVE